MPSAGQLAFIFSEAVMAGVRIVPVISGERTGVPFSLRNSSALRMERRNVGHVGSQRNPECLAGRAAHLALYDGEKHRDRAERDAWWTWREIQTVADSHRVRKKGVA